MGLFRRNKKEAEKEQLYEIDLLESTSERIQQKQLAIETCVNIIARVISQSEFRVRKDKKTVKDEMYYRLNVKPNKNTQATHFWQTFIHKLIHDNECLIIKTDTDDLLIADDFNRVEYGLVEDRFQNVTVKNFTFQRNFMMSEVIYVEYSNKKLSRLLDSLYEDYGELIGRTIEFQKLNNQIRSTVNLDTTFDKGKDGQAKLQKFIDDLYGAVHNKVFASVPQQKGLEYKEHSSSGGGSSVDEVKKVSNDFMDQVAKALGIPPALVHGEMADVENQTRNFMFFGVDPIVKKLRDELNGKFISKQSYLAGEKLEIIRPTYRDIFDLATPADKLRSSGLANGHELRDKLGLDESEDPIHDKFVITKNYSENVENTEGGGDK